MRVLPVNLRMAADDHRLLDVSPIHEQLTDGPAVAIGGNAAKADGAADHHCSQVIASRSGRHWLRAFPSQLRGIDAGKPDPLAVASPAGVAVVAAANDDRFMGRNRPQAPWQKQGHGTDCGASTCHHGCSSFELEHAVLTIGCFGTEGNARFD